MIPARRIAAERGKLWVAAFIESIFSAYGPIDLSLSPVTVAEPVHGIYRACTPAIAGSRRLFVEELISLVPVHPFSKQTGWLVGQIESQEAKNVRHFQKIPNLTVVPF